MSFLRYLMLLSLVVWVGGLIFFAFVVAPTVFNQSVLPTRHLAGNVVSRSLTALHWMGIVSGLVFLASSMIYSRMTTGEAHPFAARHILICIMLLLTIVSQFGITPKMAALRASMGEILRRGAKALRASSAEDEKLLLRMIDRMNKSTERAGKTIDDLLAYVEELLWHRGQWHDKEWLFGEGWDIEEMQLGPITLSLPALLVPLLAVPQVTHYILDGFIWRRRSNPDLALLSGHKPLA